jgi:hypothetical protein
MPTDGYLTALLSDNNIQPPENPGNRKCSHPASSLLKSRITEI